MGLFTKDKKLKFAAIPSTPGQDQARSYLTSLFGQNMDFPEMEVADLSGTEQDIQGQIRKYLSGSQGDYDTARGYFNDVLTDKYDPATSQYYQGIRGQIDTQKGEAQAQVRRTAQKAGSARSTPFMGIEARTGQEYDNQKDVVLGNLLQQERDRKAQASMGLSQLRGQEISQLSAADQVASKEREIQQQKFQAAYQKILQDLLAPYTYNAQIASTLLNEQRYAGYTTGGGMTDAGFYLNAMAGATASYLGASAGAGG